MRVCRAHLIEESGEDSHKISTVQAVLKCGGGGGSRTRVRNRCQPRDSMLSRVPKVSRRALRTDKMRTPLARESHPRDPDLTAGTSLLCDVLPRPADKALEDGYLVN